MEPAPTYIDRLPHCAGDDCALFDGKRCRATGFRPGTLCEPAVLAIIEEREALKVRAARAATIDAPPPDDLLDRITPLGACRHTRSSLGPDQHGNPVTTCIDCGEAP